MTSISEQKAAALKQFEAFASVSAATAHEAMGRRGALDSAIKPLRLGMRVLGRAFT